jgi:hypothetical protein
MNYIPNAKALVYSEIYFVSLAVPQSEVRVQVDLDRIYDEVSAEISTLYFGEARQPQANWNFTPSITCTGLEIGY